MKTEGLTLQEAYEAVLRAGPSSKMEARNTSCVIWWPRDAGDPLIRTLDVGRLCNVRISPSPFRLVDTSTGEPWQDPAYEYATGAEFLTKVAPTFADWEVQLRAGGWNAVKSGDTIGWHCDSVRRYRRPRPANATGKTTGTVECDITIQVGSDAYHAVSGRVVCAEDLPYPTKPGVALTWEQALARIDAGLPVETLNCEGRPDCGWTNVLFTAAPPRLAHQWTYRVPL